MTEREKIIQWALDQVGVTENPPGSDNVVYNTLYYGHAVNDGKHPWCMAFVWCAFNQNGLYRLFYDGGHTASCTTLMNWAKLKGQFFERGFQAGDIIFYDFDGDPSSEHTGIIVEAYSDDNLRVVEGNANSAVRLLTPRASSIMGVFRPAYADTQSAPAPAPSYPKCTPTLPVLQKGCKGIAVWSMQSLLIKCGFSVGVDGADGDFGINTQTGLRKFQEARKIEVDGICGSETWTTLYKAD